MARVDSTLDFCSRRKLMDDRLLSSVRYEKVVSFTRSSRTHSSIDPSAIAPPSSFRKKPSLEDKQSSVSLSSHFSGENKNSTSKRGSSFELYIRRIPSLVTEEHLRRLFTQVGRVGRVNIVRSSFGCGDDTGYGFVEHYSLEDAERAVRMMDGTLVNGNKLRVELTNDTKLIKTQGSSTLVTKESKNSSFQPFPATSSEGDVPAFDECDESFEPDQKCVAKLKQHGTPNSVDVFSLPSLPCKPKRPLFSLSSAPGIDIVHDVISTSSTTNVHDSNPSCFQIKMLRGLSARSRHTNQTATIPAPCINMPCASHQVENISGSKEPHCHGSISSSVNTLKLSGGEDSDTESDSVLPTLRSNSHDTTRQTPCQTTPTIPSLSTLNADEANHRLKNDELALAPLLCQSTTTSLNVGRGKGLLKFLQRRSQATPPALESTSDQPTHFYSNPSPSLSTFSAIALTENEPNDISKSTDQHNIVHPKPHSSPEADSQYSPSTNNSDNMNLSTSKSKESPKNEGSPEVHNYDPIEHPHRTKSSVVTSSSTPQKPRRVKLAAVFPQSPPSPNKMSDRKCNIELSETVQLPPLLTPTEVCSSLPEDKEFDLNCSNELSAVLQLPLPLTPVKVHQPPHPEVCNSLKSEGGERKDSPCSSLDSPSHPLADIPSFAAPVYKDQSSDDEDQSKSKDIFGRDRGEIEQSIGSLQRNTRRWQTEIKRLQQKNLAVISELNERHLEQDTTEMDRLEELTPDRLQAFDVLLKFETQLVTKRELSKRSATHREFILSITRQNSAGDKLMLLEAELTLENDEIKQKLELLKLENDLLKLKNEFYASIDP